MVNKSFLDVIRKIIIEETIYLRTYTGKVIDIDDSDKLGRVKCQIIELGWTTDDKAIWCYPNEKRGLTTVKKDDYVRISFMNKDISRAFYSGIMTEMSNMLPKNYVDKDTQIIFENNDKRFWILYKESDKELNIYDNDNNQITINQDGIIIQDKNNNITTMSTNGVKIEDKNNNTIEMKTAKIEINGTNLEIMQ